MNELERLKKTVQWLIFFGLVRNESDLASKLGYTKSSFSQIINGRVPISDKFLNNLYELSPDINLEWIRTGNGDMLLNPELVSGYTPSAASSTPSDNESVMLRVIESQQRTIEKLTDLVLNVKQ